MPDTIRTATLTDLDDMTETMCLANTKDPTWPYLYPRREEFPEDHLTGTREYMKQILDADARSYRKVMVVATPRASKTGERVVALAVWHLPFLEDSEMSPQS